MQEFVFRESAAVPRTQSIPLAHLSLELGHLYGDDFGAGPERLREHFAEVRVWADAARTSTTRKVGGRRPRISTCFLVDDYFARFSTPAEIVPVVIEEAERAGLVIDYLARESGCARGDHGTELAESLVHRLVESPPQGSYGYRPPVSRTGWLANGQRTCGPSATGAAMAGDTTGWQPPEESAARRHSVFMDVELWSDEDTCRIWSCPLLAAVWQLARLGLLRHFGEPAFTPHPWDGGDLPSDWERLPPLLKVNPGAAPFSAYRTCTLVPNRFLAVEDAVRVILDQVDVDRDALRQVAERSLREGIEVPDSVARRATYVFYEDPTEVPAPRGD